MNDHPEQRVYFVSDPGGYDWNARKIGVYSTLERAQQVASHDDDTDIWSTILDHPMYCSDKSHNDRYEEKREGMVYLSTGWVGKEKKS